MKIEPGEWCIPKVIYKGDHRAFLSGYSYGWLWARGHIFCDWLKMGGLNQTLLGQKVVSSPIRVEETHGVVPPLLFEGETKPLHYQGPPENYFIGPGPNQTSQNSVVGIQCIFGKVVDGTRTCWSALTKTAEGGIHFCHLPWLIEINVISWLHLFKVVYASDFVGNGRCLMLRQDWKITKCLED